MEKAASGVQTVLDEVALRVVTLEADDIPGLGMLLSDLDRLISALKSAGAPEIMGEVAWAIRSFTENLILGEASEVRPLEDGVVVLQEMERSRIQGVAWPGDAEEILRSLGIRQAMKADAPLPQGQGPEVETKGGEARIFTAQDQDILSDFVVEAAESLSSIEVRLIDLEEDPGDVEILNAIFRPFHTIKGVAGFLDLFEINRLAHSTETLLDNARQGIFSVNHEVIDMILTSVDTLRRLIACAEESLADHGKMPACHVDIHPLIQRMEGYKAPPEGNRLGEILVSKGLVSEEAVKRGLERQQAEGKPLGEILVSEEKVPSREVISALRDQKRSRPGSGGPSTNLQVKVDTAKLDNLVDLTGELVIAQAMLRQQTSERTSGVGQQMGRMGQIISDIQKLAMGMRMVQIGSTFQRMVRLVRELSRSSGKQVCLEMSGQDTEIDRNVVEALYEPMVHMIRNAVDHGLENPEERAQVGKPEKGRVRLQAYHKGGSILIELADDGRGLNADRIFAKAVERGLVAAEASLTREEIFDLIFHPGFSTAAAITDVSGRGVGMDVVKKVVETLRGRLDIQSEPGQGTRFLLTLPLTMAIIDGMLVRVGGERYIIPAIAIVESFRPARKDVFTVGGRGEMVMVRGELVPLIRLGLLCGVVADHDKPWEALVVVVENKERKRALFLDELLGKEEFVIKNMGETFRHLTFLAGGSILGDGRVGLILDMAGLFDMADAMETAGWEKGPNTPDQGDEEGP
ncbi:chemotaxis protein CheA [Desulfobotulus sp.]|jgi:two-component system chemotaxis sensor kinase CheA|uniref:chemotaxis protein CheA n=1 Tax=Desulfobotulus sp. TaxID=1940337 RepID=UPI002A35FF5B|nr:chemotaxis protein CheA [Desulfobotulus sp.]MDY0163667.1 chemotaxis protein CheA [Desulfobotulus sp.]